MATPGQNDFPEIVERLRDLGIADDPAFEAEILGDFLKDAEKVVAALAQAIASKDAAECERLAHRLRGASQNLGASAMAGPAFEIEQQGRAGDVTAARSAYETLAAEFHDVRAFIEEHIRSFANRS
ncbi:MAG: Hpt domain-containing protein [bacterium]